MNKYFLNAGQFCMLSEALKQGVKFARLAGNREINFKRTKELYDSVMKDPEKTFTVHLCVAQARKAIEAGLKLYRCDDNTEVQKDDSDIDLIWVIIDGQHRYWTIKRFENEEIDASVVLRDDLEGVRLVNAAKNYNTHSVTWNKPEHEHFNREAGLYNENTKQYQDAVRAFAEIFGVKLGVASYAIDYQKDKTRKCDAEEGKNISHTFSQSNVDRAYGCMKAMRYKFANQSNIVKTINGLAFLPEARNRTPDEQMPNFSTDAKRFIACMDGEAKEKALELYNAKDFKGYTDYMVDEFMKFQKLDEAEKQELYSIVEADVESNFEEIKKANQVTTIVSVSIAQRIEEEHKLDYFMREAEKIVTKVKSEEKEAKATVEGYKKANKGATPSKDATLKSLIDKHQSVKKYLSDLNKYFLDLTKAERAFVKSKEYDSTALVSVKKAHEAYVQISQLVSEYDKIK